MFFRISFLILGIFCFLKSAESETQTISQLVIVYSPKQDQNGAFHSYDESLTRLFEAAKKQNLRIVLIDADKFEGKNSKELLKKAVEGTVSAQPSFLVIGTHGGQIKNLDGTTDTSLSFPGGINFGDFKGAFESKNFRGVSVVACHSDNKVMKDLGARSIACASSQSDLESTSAFGNYYANALSSAIRLGQVDDLLVHMRSSILSQAELAGHGEKELLGEGGDISKLPIYGPKGYAVNFSGKGYEVVDAFGNSMTPCYTKPQNEKEKVKILSLPAKFIPPRFQIEATADSSFLSDFYFNSHPRLEGVAFKLECSEKGEVVIKEGEECEPMDGIEIGNQCEESALKHLRMPSRTPPNEFIAPPFNQTAKKLCDALNSDVKKWRDSGFKVEVKRMCTNWSCNYNFGEVRDSYSIGQCTKSGGICMPTPSGAIALDGSPECRQLIRNKYDQQTKDPSCIDNDYKLQENECFVPAFPPNNVYISWVNHNYPTANTAEITRLAHSQVASFKCEKSVEEGTTYYRARFNEECCKKNNGVIVQGVEPPLHKDQKKDYYSTDMQQHKNYMQAHYTAIGPRCEKKPEAILVKPKRNPVNNEGYPGGYDGGYPGTYPDSPNGKHNKEGKEFNFGGSW